MSTTETTTIRPEGRRKPQLDGLRAWAITGVVLSHLGIPWTGGGGIGVDLFFVLSGFLITHLLLREYDRRGSIDVVAFYRRRAWRLLPALVLMLVVVDVFTWLQPWGEPAHGLSHADLIGSLWVLGFLANWTNEWIGSYIHLWSLSIEEQFYIVWAPLMILLTPRVHRSTVAKVLLAVAVLDLAVQAGLFLAGMASIGRLHNATYSHVYGLLVGAALALALTYNGRVEIAGWTIWLRRLSLPAFLLLTASVILPIYISPDEIVLVYLPLTTVACGLLVGGVVVGGGRWTSILALAPVVWLGRISYSLYLWHLPVYVAFEETVWARDHLFMSGVLKLGISVALAAASFHVVEQPLLRRFAGRDSTAVKGSATPAAVPA